MTALRDAVARLSGLGALPCPPVDRPTELDKVVARLGPGGGGDGGRSGTDESWEAVARRMDFVDLAANRPRDIRRALNEIWQDGDRSGAAAPLVRFSLSAQRKTFDRELLLAYLRSFPHDHPAAEPLFDAVETAADRHSWPWRERGRRFKLWNPNRGPGTLGDALLAAEAPLAVLTEAGFDGDLATGKFVVTALNALCEQAGNSFGAKAEQSGWALVDLFNTIGVGGTAAMIAFALLNPWRERMPSPDFRKTVGGILVSWIGDPQLDSTAWDHVCAELRRLRSGYDPRPLLAALKRWLIDTRVRAFFTVVARTTDRPDQWAAREAFWLALLDSQAISDAWFALGRQAGSLAREITEESGVEGHGEITGAGATARQSALLMSIGDVRIAEWSDNGACRFWSAADPSAPVLGRSSYYGIQLRAMNGGRGHERRFAHLSHTSGWQDHFAAFIYAGSGVQHPRHKRGHGGRAW